MNFVRIFLFAFLLLLPVATMAEENASPKDSTSEKEDFFFPLPCSFTIGGGPKMFSVGVDVLLGKMALLYETSRPDTVGTWLPTHTLVWTNRIRMIYDYENHQYGFFLQPNLRYFFKFGLFETTLGPEIGWQTKTGFDWGASVRLKGVLTLLLADLEFGYLVNVQRAYFNVLFDLSVFTLAMDW